MYQKPVFVITNDQQLFLINYKINSKSSMLTWSPDISSAIVFYTARRTERIKKQLELCSCYQLCALEAFRIDKTLQISVNNAHSIRFTMSRHGH